MKLPKVKPLLLHPPSRLLPEDAWLLEQGMFNTPGDGRTVDRKFRDPRPTCILCATWICAGCWDFRRSRASRVTPHLQACPKCGSAEGFYIAIRHFRPHSEPRIPLVPFPVPSMAGCPAGTPCPGTGCPACCPSYDPCGLKSCTANCNPLQKKVVPSNTGEQEFWGTHKFQESPDLFGCGLCGWGYNDAIHSPHPQEKKMTNPHDFHTGEGDPKNDHIKRCLRCGLPEETAIELSLNTCEASGEVLAADQSYIDPKTREGVEILGDGQVLVRGVAPEEAFAGLRGKLTVLEDPAPRYPHVDGDNLVLGPEVFVNIPAGVISWKGENYSKQPEPQMAPGISNNSYMRRDAMEWAIRLREVIGTIDGGMNPRYVAEGTVDMAQKIYEWLTKE